MSTSGKICLSAAAIWSVCCLLLAVTISPQISRINYIRNDMMDYMKGKGIADDAEAWGMAGTKDPEIVQHCIENKRQFAVAVQDIRQTWDKESKIKQILLLAISYPATFRAPYEIGRFLAFWPAICQVVCLVLLGAWLHVRSTDDQQRSSGSHVIRANSKKA